MALNFPNNPGIGNVFTDTTSGFSYEWDGTVWKSYSAASSSQIKIIDDISGSFTGVAKTFALASSGVSLTPPTAQSLLITLSGVVQEPIVDYTISTSNIIFVDAPSAGLAFGGISLGPAVPITTIPNETSTEGSFNVVGVLSAANLKVTGVSTFVGFTTHTGTIFGSHLSLTGVATASSFVGNLTGTASTASFATVAGIATYTSEWILGANGSSDYTFTGSGFTGAENDPTLYLIRGQQYKFTNTMGAHPFRIQSTPNGSVGTQYNDGITNNDVSNGTLTWNVQFDAPSLLYYQCTAHASMGGKIYIIDAGIGADISINTTGIITASSFVGNLTGTATGLSGNPSISVTGVNASGITTVSAGSAAAPSISPSGDSNTGIFFSAADTINASTGGTSRITIDSNGNITLTNNFYVPLGSAAAPSISFTGDTNTGIYSPGADQVAISTNGSGRLFVDSSGRVGVGATSPSEALTVSGKIQATTEFKSETGNDLRLNAGSVNRDIFMQVNGSTLMTVQGSTGRVGIGTTSPARLLHVAGSAVFSDTVDTTVWAQFSTGVGGVGTNNNYPFAFATNGSERARIDSSGRLLVGTTSASGNNLLQVNSDALFNGVTVGRGATGQDTNTAVGSGAMQTTGGGGSNNTAMGYQAGFSFGGGSNNTAMGNNALRSVSGGFNNTAVGYQAGFSISGGSNNTAVGYQAGQAFGSSVNMTALGYQACFPGGNNNTGLGYQACLLGGSNNTGVGYQAFKDNTGSGNVCIGSVNASGTYAPAYNITTENNRVVMGSTSVTHAYIQVAWTPVSDARDKTNFGIVPHGLDFVKQLNPISFQFKETRDATEPHGPVRYGFKAQDILALEGEENAVIIDNEDPEKLRYNGEALVPVLVNAIKEQQSIIEQQQVQIEQQQVQIDALLARLDAAGI